MATWEEFYKKANDEGLYGQFSQEELNRIRGNADYGMEQLNAKIGYRDAKSPEEQQMYHDIAENNRIVNYGFSGGTDGSMYFSNDTPTVTNPNAALTSSAFMNFNPGKAPTRNTEYEDLYRDYLNQIINRKAFSYDAENDPNYLQYKNQYTREGNRAMQDTLGQMSARTGGLASSYAGTAAAQANNYYMQQLADKIPELYQQAYNRYLQDFQMQMDTLGAIGNGRDYNLNAYQTDYDVFNTDAQREYQALSDYYNGYMNEQQQAKENAWTEADRAMKEEEWKAKMADAYAQMGNYDRLLELGGDPSLYQPTSSGGGYYGGGGTPSSSSSDGSRKGTATPGTGAQSAVTAGIPTAKEVYDYDSAKTWLQKAGASPIVIKELMRGTSWDAKRAWYKLTGKGDAAVANYDSYDDYVRAYCEYALSVS